MLHQLSKHFVDFFREPSSRAIKRCKSPMNNGVALVILSQEAREKMLVLGTRGLVGF